MGIKVAWGLPVKFQLVSRFSDCCAKYRNTRPPCVVRQGLPVRDRCIHPCQFYFTTGSIRPENKLLRFACLAPSFENRTPHAWQVLVWDSLWWEVHRAKRLPIFVASRSRMFQDHNSKPIRKMWPLEVLRSEFLPPRLRCLQVVQLKWFH